MRWPRLSNVLLGSVLTLVAAKTFAQPLPSLSHFYEDTVAESIRYLEEQERKTREAEQRLVDKHGAQNVVRLRVAGVPSYARVFVSPKVASLGLRSSVSGDLKGAVCYLVLAPVSDVQAYAAGIDFAEDLEIDLPTRTITFRMKASAVPRPLDPPITVPYHPDFYRRNLEDVKCWNHLRRQAAVRRLAWVKPLELRKEIEQALLPLLHDEFLNLCDDAAQALAVWGSADVVDELIGVLKQEQSTPRLPGYVMAALVEIKDQRGIDAIAAELGLGASHAGEAKKWLIRLGPAAEASVVPYLTHEDGSVRAQALEVLKVIGTKEHFAPALIPWLQSNDMGARRDALRLIGKFKHTEALPAISQCLLNLTDVSLAEDCLKQMGPCAEDFVIQGLQFPNAAVVQSCCQVLEDIGSEKSIEALTACVRMNNPRFSPDAQQAGRAVVLRQRLLALRASPDEETDATGSHDDTIP